MSAQNAPKSRLFLLELLLMILFFASASSICIQIFAKAHSTSQGSVNLTQSVLLAQSASAVFSKGDGTGQTFLTCWPKGVATTDTFTTFFDSDWTETGESSGVYQLTIALTSQDSCTWADLTIRNADTQAILYQLAFSQYQEAHYET